jgi:hypothetical protein
MTVKQIGAAAKEGQGATCNRQSASEKETPHSVLPQFLLLLQNSQHIQCQVPYSVLPSSFLRGDGMEVSISPASRRICTYISQNDSPRSTPITNF